MGKNNSEPKYLAKPPSAMGLNKYFPSVDKFFGDDSSETSAIERLAGLMQETQGAINDTLSEQGKTLKELTKNVDNLNKLLIEISKRQENTDKRNVKFQQEQKKQQRSSRVASGTFERQWKESLKQDANTARKEQKKFQNELRQDWKNVLKQKSSTMAEGIVDSLFPSLGKMGLTKPVVGLIKNLPKMGIAGLLFGSKVLGSGIGFIWKGLTSSLDNIGKSLFKGSNNLFKSSKKGFLNFLFGDKDAKGTLKGFSLKKLFSGSKGLNAGSSTIAKTMGQAGKLGLGSGLLGGTLGLGGLAILLGLITTMFSGSKGAGGAGGVGGLLNPTSGVGADLLPENIFKGFKNLSNWKNRGKIAESLVKGNNVTKISTAGKVLGKTGFKTLSKTALKKIPLLNAGLGLYYGTEAFKEGDYLGAGLELLSAGLPTIGGAVGGAVGALGAGVGAAPGAAIGTGLGIGASAGLDWYLSKRKAQRLIEKQQKQEEAQDKIINETIDTTPASKTKLASPSQVINTTGLTPIQQKIVVEAQKQGVDPALALAMAKQESGFNPNAKSSVGAIGTMQLMPQTAKGLGVNPYDVDQNIHGGIKYLKQQLDANKGNVSLALASYNAGYGNVKKYGGIPPFAETQNYVKNILKSYNAMNDLLGKSQKAIAQQGNYTLKDTASSQPLTAMKDLGLQGTIWSQNTKPYIASKNADRLKYLDAYLAGKYDKVLYTSAMGGHTSGGHVKGNKVDIQLFDKSGTLVKMNPEDYKYLSSLGYFGTKGAIGYEKHTKDANWHYDTNIAGTEQTLGDKVVQALPQPVASAVDTTVATAQAIANDLFNPPTKAEANDFGSSYVSVDNQGVDYQQFKNAEQASIGDVSLKTMDMEPDKYNSTVQMASGSGINLEQLEWFQIVMQM